MQKVKIYFKLLVNQVEKIRMYTKKENLRRVLCSLKLQKEIICSDKTVLPVCCFSLLMKLKGQFLLVAPNAAIAEEIYGGLVEFKNLFGLDKNFYLLEDLPKNNKVVPENESERPNIFFEMLKGDSSVIISAGACSSTLRNPKAFLKDCFLLKPGDSISLTKLTEKLAEMDYDDEYQVSTPYAFAIRGGIIDVYSSAEQYPARIEFFGNEIESIRYFSPETQKTVSKAERYTFIPRMSFNESKFKSNLLDYFPSIPSVIMVFPVECRENLVSESGDYDRFIEKFQESEQFVKILREIDADFIESKQERERFLPIPSTIENVFDEDIELIGKELYSQMRRDQIKFWIENNYHISIFCGTKSGQKHVYTWLEENKINFPSIVFCEGELSHGFVVADKKLVILSEKEIYYNPHRRILYQKNIFKRAVRESEDYNMAELDIGEYVVHIIHGIGIYHGITEIEMSESLREVMEIEYEAGVRLYVPIWQAGMVSRYVGTSKTLPSLSKLGSNRWLSIKDSAIGSVKQLASEMLRIQAVRSSSSGHAFPSDDEEQINFEMAFPYEETQDQLRAADDIKKDLMSSRPMDRLLCGDVGYGKTEVAMRAVFKAVMAGKQTAILTPTTILAQQHFYTFSERFVEYPVIIEVLSRFKDKAEQDRIIKDLEEGKVDIIIGTHRLIQDDVKFANLGLLIIDEEQRFGVLHKEKFKRLRATVDILTMTATPIPRTLYLAMAGVRDLSTIMTAPSNRLPVQTILCKFDNDIISEAVYREVKRNGQVFFIHNRVKSIEQRCSQLREIMPDLRIESAHGQMEDDELEHIMARFIDGKINVLVSTTIVESGVDIPNANTIMIERADMFGLAELYQLRGRVGRWSRQAYAYLFIPDSSVISGTARERLSAIKKYTQLGAGFRLALKDLEIRGSGNVLGAQQSGHINAVGFNLYCQLLKSAISGLKGKKEVRFFYVDIFFDFIDFSLEPAKGKINACLPKDYIPSERLRIEFYRRFSEIWNFSELEELEHELIDRFGKVPLESERFISIMKIRIATALAGYNSISVRDGYIYIEGSGGKQFLVNGKVPRLKNVEPSLKLKELEGYIKSWVNL